MAIDQRPTISLEDFKLFEQEIMLDLIVGGELRYAQRFFDRFSHLYVWLLEHENGKLYLDQLYKIEDTEHARSEIIQFVESDPLNANSNSTIP